MHPRFELHADLQSLAAWAELPSESIHVPQTVASDGRQKLHPVLLVSGQHGRAISWMREGLIPSYACDDHDAVKRAEAHAEAMTCDSCFRSAFRRRRCIVPADVVHEVRHLAPGLIHPCSFSLESGKIFGIAAVWETWINDEGHSIESFAIVTTLVTPLLRSIFERMPVILESHDEREQWLSHDQPDTGPVDLLKPLSGSQLRAWSMTPEAIALRIPGGDAASA